MYHNRPRRRKFRSNGRQHHRRGNGDKQRHSNSNPFLNGQIRGNPFKGHHNAQKLIEKYTSLAKEALSSGDKILSENYLQHADHFSRINASNNVSQNKINDDQKNKLNEPTSSEDTAQEDNQTLESKK